MGVRLPEQLPQLHGWVLALYRYGLPILIVLGIFTTLYLSPSRMAHDNHNNRILLASGLKLFGFQAEGQRVAPFSPEAHAAGMGESALLTAIDGHPAPTDIDDVVARLDRPNGTPLRITVRNSDRVERTITLHRNTNFVDAVYARVGLTYEGQRLARTVIGSIGFLLGLLVASLLYLRRRRDPVAALIAFGATIVSIDVRLMTNGVMSLGAQDILLRFPAAAIYVSAGIGLSLFPSGRFVPRTTWAAIAMFIVSASLVQLAWNDSRWLFPLNVASVITMSILVMVIVQRYRREPDGIAKQQMKFGLLGIAFMAFFFSLSILIQIRPDPDSDEGITAWSELISSAIWSLGWICAQLGLLVSLLRFRLYDAETAISRSAVAGALTLFLGFIFAASEKLLENVGQSYLGPQSQGTSAAISAVIAATLVAPVHHRLSRWAERRFQKNLIELRDDLPRVVGDLRETASSERLAQIALGRIEMGVRSTRGAILLGGRVIAVDNVGKATVNAWLKANPVDATELAAVRNVDDLLFPMQVPLEAEGCGHVGWLLLGPRPDGTLFSKDETEALAAIANPLARALAIAAARKQESGRLRTLLTALEKRIARVEMKLA